MLVVPYFKQEHNHFCGPACLQMIFAFYNQNISQEKLAQQLGVSEEEGTHNKAMVRVAEEAGFGVETKTDAAWEDVEKYVQDGKLIIVNFVEPSESGGHFAVVVDIEAEELILNDPWNGINFRIGKDDFLNRWRSGFEEYQRWLLVIYPPNH